MLRPLISESLVWRGPAQSDSRRDSCPRNPYRRAIFAATHRREFILLALLTALTSLAAAQKAASAHPAPTRPAIRRSASPKASLTSARQAHRSPKSPSSPFSLLAPFLGDSFNLDDFTPTNDPGASQPPPMLLQAANSLSGADYPGRPDNNREPSSNQPLMIELQGDRYVRVDNTAINGEAQPLQLAPGNIHTNNVQPSKSTRNYSTRLTAPIPSTAQAPMIAASASPRDLPPAVLVFQDGHTEEVREYTIADGFLYARGDCYTDGYWNKKIDLSALNLPQTFQANNNRNIKFALPTLPNEVMTRP